MKKLSGVVTALMTLRDAHGTPDTKGTVMLAKHCIQGGVDGLFVLGTNGEGINFSVEQRMEVSRAVIEGIDRSKAKVCIHTGSSRLEETVALTRGACKLGADCAAIVTPAFIPYSDAELYRYYREISESVPDNFSLYLYNIPPRTGNDIKPEVVERLVNDCKNIVGVKASFCNLERTAQYLGIKGSSMLQGSDIYQLEYLAMNCDGIISGLSGVYPEPFVQVRMAWLENNIESARRWQNICFKVCEALDNGDVGTMKLAMRLKGFSVYLADEPGAEKEKQLKEKLNEIDAMIYKARASRLAAV